jgi:putative tryptophan/tyrosine transport system substrate-binding protein
MRRREFITLLGRAAVAWPLAARAAQVNPVVGLLSGGAQSEDAFRIDALSEGLASLGFRENRDVAFLYRGAMGHYQQLPRLAAELVKSPVAVIASLGPTLAGLAAKGASRTVPVVFYVGADPVKVGLVSGLNHPGANVTGVSQMYNFVIAKQFELLREVVPKVDLVGFLVNPANSNAESDTADAQVAAHALDRTLIVVGASTDDELEIAFSTLSEKAAGALLQQPDHFFRGRIQRIAALALHYRLPMLTSWRDCTKAGGLLSYGASQTEGHYQQGIYVGRILKGEKPADLPVVLPTKFELALNLKTAKALSITIPLAVQASAEEVVE